MAIQLARALGSTVYATASSAEKCRVCEALGASRAINYKEEGFVDIVKRETGGAGVALRLGTRVELDFGVVQRKHLAITGSMLRPRPIAEKGRLVAAVGKAVWPLIERGQIKPVVDSIFPLAEAARAHERMESGAHIGKVLLTMG
jgi:NADPH2:quinone reductase